jgi:hypothetical protein
MSDDLRMPEPAGPPSDPDHPAIVVVCVVRRFGETDDQARARFETGLGEHGPIFGRFTEPSRTPGHVCCGFTAPARVVREVLKRYEAQFTGALS